MQPTESSTFAMMISLVARFIPARRTSRVDHLKVNVAHALMRAASALMPTRFRAAVENNELR